MALGPILFGIALTVVCTAHLCLGYWIGSLRGTHAAKDVASRKRIEQIEKMLDRLRTQLAIANEISSEAVRINKRCRSLNPQLPNAMLDDLKLLSGDIEQLKKQLHGAVSDYKQAYDAEISDHEQRRLRSRSEPPPNANCLTNAKRQLHNYITGQPAALPQRRLERWLGTTPRDNPAPDSTETAPLDDGHQQWLAPLDDRLPYGDDFIPITCKEITRESLIFFADDKPGYSHAIVTIGSPDDQTFMLVQLEHSVAVYMLERVWYRVSCAFIKRVDPSLYWWDAQTGQISCELTTQAAP